MSCKLIPDERWALEIEIARLQNENERLKKELQGQGYRAQPYRRGASAERASADGSLGLTLATNCSRL